MGNVHREILDLKARVEQLEDRLAEEMSARETLRNSLVYRLNSIRALVIRSLAAEPGEKWHVGPEYTNGTRLKIPPRPRRLRLRAEVERLPRRDISMQRALKLFECEGIIDGYRDGVRPKRSY